MSGAKKRPKPDWDLRPRRYCVLSQHTHSETSEILFCCFTYFPAGEFQSIASPSRKESTCGMSLHKLFTKHVVASSWISYDFVEG